MQMGVIADDFTGASDVAGTIRRAGLPTVLAFNTCPQTLPDGFAAIVVALKIRSIAAADAIREATVALEGLQRLGATQIYFKICSTFDSTPEGNIGPVTEALAKVLSGAAAVVVCPAFPDARRTVYAGHLFVGEKLLSESGMEKHPLNPMRDPDIRRWLTEQTRGSVGYLPLAAVQAGEAAIRACLDQAVSAGHRLIIADAVANSDLMTLGRALVDAALVTGASGVAMGLAAAHAGSGASDRTTAVKPIEGPGLVLVGSCSVATLAQVRRYAEGQPALAVDAARVVRGEMTSSMALRFVDEHRGEGPMVYSSVEPNTLRAVQAEYGMDRVATALEAFFGEVAIAAVAAGFRRLVVAGGETSGAVVSALDLRMLAVGNEIALGVPALVALDRPLALALKSGNFGDPDFFETALAVLAAGVVAQAR